MAPTNDHTSEPADLPDSTGTGSTAGQVGRSLALLSLAGFVDSAGNAVGSRKQGKCI